MKRAHHDLKAWQISMHLVEDVYRLTSAFPDSEKFGLIAQMRRASISVPSNIAEGAGRNSDGEFLNFLGIARGSLSELETQLHLSRRLGFVGSEPIELMVRIDEAFSLIGGLINSVKNRRD